MPFFTKYLLYFTETFDYNVHKQEELQNYLSKTAYVARPYELQMSCI